MKKVSNSIVIIGIFIFSFSGCKKDTAPHSATTPTTSGNGKVTINGAAQKGPFANGASITVYELDNQYSQTGKSFFTQINDNSGSFQLNNISLSSNNVQLRADGFYFNEVCGVNSASQISLNCISNLANSGSLNINLLTHLEKPRVEFLIASGLSFDSAKARAQSDILNIFNISLNSVSHSENLDISQSGDGNAALLAVSSILQGFRTEAELSSVLAAISNDIKSDGVLNDSATKSSLIDHAVLLDTVVIKSNLLNFYSGLGLNVSIPFFGKYINQFVVNSVFIKTNSVITYPINGLYGGNLLFKSQVNYAPSTSNFSFAGKTKKCTPLTIKMHLISGTFPWGYNSSPNLNVSVYDWTNNSQFFTVINPDQPFDCLINFSSGSTTILIEYFETSSTTPSFSKTITVN